MGRGLVSCIIPTHNRSSLLKEAVDSVISQTHQNLEIIIVNDGSGDGTEDVLSKLKKGDSRVISLSNKKPEGPSAARNKGIRIAKGDFIAFLDDDDQWKPNRISDNLDFLKDYDASLCSSTKECRYLFNKHKMGLINIDDFKKGNFGACHFMGHSYVFNDIEFDEDLFVGEDWDLFIRIARKLRIGYLNKPLVIVNDCLHSSLTKNVINMPMDKLEERLGVLYKHNEFLGPYWFNYHVAGRFLSYIRYRDNKLKYIIYTTRRCGIFAVLRVFYNKIYRFITG